MTRDQINKLTAADVAAAKANRGAVSTIDYVLSQVGGKRTLDAAKQYLISIIEKTEQKAAR